MKTVLITGASSGFGWAMARLFAAQGYRLILIARRQERLDLLKAQLESDTQAKVYIQCCDVRNQVEVENVLQSLPIEWRNIDVLINNAGLAKGKAPIHEMSFDHMNQMIDTNVKGLSNADQVRSSMWVPLRAKKRIQAAMHIAPLNSLWMP